MFLSGLILLAVTGFGDGIPLSAPAGASGNEKTHTESSKRFRDEVIGTSAGGLPIVRTSFSHSFSPPPARRIALIAGLEGDRPASAQAAKSLLNLLKGDELSWLPGDVALDVFAEGNPDGLARWSDITTSTPVVVMRGNDRPVDDDRDRLFDEDGPEDLDGDGHITTIRLPDPAGEWTPHPEEPRLLVELSKDLPRSEGRFRLFSEGTDNDDPESGDGALGDGLINEDGPGGAGPARNFPHAFPEHLDSSGRHPLSEPESRSIADAILSEAGTVLVIALSDFDGVRGKADSGNPPGGRPRKPSMKIDPDDVALFKELTAKAREHLNLTDKESRKWTYPGGHVAGWAYFHLGIPAIAIPVRSQPPTPEGEDPAPPGDEFARDRAWLAHSDLHPQLQGFIPWHAIENRPQHLEGGQIGGFRPGFRELLRSEEQAAWGKGLLNLLGDLCAELPRVAISALSDRKIGDGIYILDAWVTDTTRWPQRTAQARRNRHVLPGRVTISVDGGSVMGQGKFPRNLAPGDAGGVRHLEWIINAPEGTRVTVRVTTELAGTTVAEKKLGIRREVF